MEERLQGASREELLHHIITQRRLIRQLHRHIVELERVLSVAHPYGASQTVAAAAQSLPSRAPPPATSSQGIAEIDRVMRAHASGEMRLPAETVAELLYIRRELTISDSTEGVKPLSDGLSTHVTPPSAIKPADPTPLASPSINDEACVFTTPAGRAAAAPWRGSPPASLVKLTRRRLLMDN